MVIKANETIVNDDNTTEVNEVAIKKINNIFEHAIYAKRCLRELKILRLLDNHEYVRKIFDLIFLQLKKQYQHSKQDSYHHCYGCNLPKLLPKHRCQKHLMKPAKE